MKTMPSQSTDDALWRGEVTAELRHIQHSLTELHHELADLRNYVADQFDDHRAYHARNEVRWGPVRWCERHPFQLAVLLLGVFATMSLWRSGIDWLQLTGTILQLFK